MDREKLLGIAFVAMPITHIVTCAIFLAGYSAGFGSKVGLFFSPGDIFGLSVTELFWTYLGVIIIPIVAISSRLLPGYKSRLELAVETNDERKIRAEEKWNKLFVRSLTVIFAIHSIAVAAIAILAMNLDERIPYTEISWVLAFWTVWLTGYAAGKAGFSGNFAYLSSIFIVMLLVAFISGLERGQNERRGEHLLFADTRPHCLQWSILRAAGDDFIAVDPGNHRAVIDKIPANPLRRSPIVRHFVG